MKYILIGFINFYQKVLSPDTGFLPWVFGLSRKTCIFYPSCSNYAKTVIELHGPIKGASLAIDRIKRCNPMNDPEVDLPEDTITKE